MKKTLVSYNLIAFIVFYVYLFDVSEPGNPEAVKDKIIFIDCEKQLLT